DSRAALDASLLPSLAFEWGFSKRCDFDCTIELSTEGGEYVVRISGDGRSETHRATLLLGERYGFCNTTTYWAGTREFARDIRVPEANHGNALGLRALGRAAGIDGFMEDVTPWRNRRGAPLPHGRLLAAVAGELEPQ